MTDNRSEKFVEKKLALHKLLRRCVWRARGAEKICVSKPFLEEFPSVKLDRRSIVDRQHRSLPLLVWCFGLKKKLRWNRQFTHLAGRVQRPDMCHKQRAFGPTYMRSLWPSAALHRRSGAASVQVRLEMLLAGSPFFLPFHSFRCPWQHPGGQ